MRQFYKRKNLEKKSLRNIWASNRFLLFESRKFVFRISSVGNNWTKSKMSIIDQGPNSLFIIDIWIVRQWNNNRKRKQLPN